MAIVGGRASSLYLLATFSLLSIVLYLRNTDNVTIINPSTGEPWDAANSTLGFGALYVVSSPDSPRRAHLGQAATITGLDLTIPRQRQWTDKDVTTFRWDNESESQIGVGSVKAWLSHHLVLHAFLDSGAETALIFEDDIDWDIRLRTTQIPLAQRASRRLSGQTENEGPHNSSSSSSSSAARLYPWGHPLDWDLLYLGHCGDYWGDVEEGVGVGYVHPLDLAETPHVTYRDQTVLTRTDLHPFTASLLTGLGIPEQSRVLHHSKWPLCSFGYAITRSTAQKILSEIAPAKEDISRNIKAYDVALMAACRDSYALRCFSLTPELFHHMEGQSLIEIEEEGERQIFRPPVDAAGARQSRWRKETANIGCGFWSGEFYFDWGDREREGVLREQVGRLGRCLKAGRTTSSWWRG